MNRDLLELSRMCSIVCLLKEHPMYPRFSRFYAEDVREWRSVIEGSIERGIKTIPESCRTQFVNSVKSDLDFWMSLCHESEIVKGIWLRNMGAFGYKPFENDDALDWLSGLSKSGLKEVERILQFSIDKKTRLSLVETSKAIAGCYLVYLGFFPRIPMNKRDDY
ncbi:MAG: DUF4259 domain-containing protein [Pirellulaceae bacterium]